MLRKFAISIILSLVVSLSAKAETGLSRDSLARAIDYLEKQPPSFRRDTILAVYYNELCEKSIYAGDSLAEERLLRFEKAYKMMDWPIAKAMYMRALGKKYDKAGNYERALENYHAAIRIMEQNPCSPQHLVYTHILMGYVMLNSGDEKACWEMFKKVEGPALKLKDTSYAIWIFDFYGDNTLFHATGEKGFEKALAYYKEAEKLLPNSLVRNQTPNNFLGQAQVYALLGEAAQADKYRQKALHVSLENKHYFNLFNIYEDLSNASQKKGEWAAAIAYAEKSLEAAQKFGYLEMINRARYGLYEAQKGAGNTQEALQSLEIYLKLEDSLKRQAVNEKYAELNKKYEFEKRQSTVRELNLKYSLVAFAIVLIAGSLIFLLQVKSKKRISLLNQQLQHRNREVEEALHEGKKLERKRVSDRLHDSVATKISALKWKVEMNENQLSPDTYGFLIGELEKLYEDVRGMAHNLRPLEFLEKGLQASIEELFKNLKVTTTYAFDLHINGGINELPKSQQYHIYQWIMELCTNMKKHAKPERVLFELSLLNKQILLHFRNDGLLNDHVLKENQGLRNIRGKVGEYKGKIKIEKSETFDLRITIPV